MKALRRATKISVKAALFIGASRAADLFGDRQEPYRFARHAATNSPDAAALASDWQEVGADFGAAASKLNVRKAH